MNGSIIIRCCSDHAEISSSSVRIIYVRSSPVFFLVVAENTGDAFTYIILTDDEEIVHRSVIRTASAICMASTAEMTISTTRDQRSDLGAFADNSSTTCGSLLVSSAEVFEINLGKYSMY